jgi:hypothetical protein
MSANRIVQRRAFLSSIPSAWDHAARERQATKLGLPKITPRPTFREWVASRVGASK